MICRSTLLPVKEGLYSNKAAKALFGPHTPIGQLPFSRRDFFIEAPGLVEGMSMSGRKLSVVRDFFDRILFAYLVGNDDMHLKNISLNNLV